MEQVALWLAQVVVAGVLSFAGAYLAMKGKNVATREDVGKIEREVQGIRHEYERDRQERSHRHQLRMAALDARLRAHQEAYDLWMQVAARANNAVEVHTKVIECQEWWRKNCLYLTEEAREAFSSAYMAASLHPGLLQSRVPSEDVKANWATIRAAGPALTRAVALPSIAQDEPQL